MYQKLTLRRSVAIRLCACFVLAWCFQPAFPQTPVLDGFVEIDHISYFKNQPPPTINRRNQAILELKLSGEISDQASFYAETELRDDQSNSVRNRIFLKEAYIDFYAGNLDVRFGKQIIRWGKTDYVNPTDNISPWDFTDILDTEDEQLGVLALKSDLYAGDFAFEWVAVPQFEASDLPGLYSRWFPPLSDFLGDTISQPVTHPVPFLVDAAKTPEQTLANTQLAMKVSWSGHGWDLSVSGYHGWNDLPDYRVSLQQVGSQFLPRVQPAYNRLNVLGGDFAATLGKWNARGEAAYFFTADAAGTDPEIDDPYFQFVLGLDRQFSMLPDGRNLFLLAQWVQEIPRHGFNGEGADLRHVFQRSLLGKVEGEVGDRTKVGIEGAYNFRHGDYFMRPYWRRELADGVILRVSADILGGSDKGFFGVYANNDRVQLRLKYSF